MVKFNVTPSLHTRTINALDHPELIDEILLPAIGTKHVLALLQYYSFTARFTIEDRVTNPTHAI